MERDRDDSIKVTIEKSYSEEWKIWKVLLKLIILLKFL